MTISLRSENEYRKHVENGGSLVQSVLPGILRMHRLPAPPWDQMWMEINMALSLTTVASPPTVTATIYY